MKFIYRSGQRPLDGYTIKRGLGSGGFGEVYFAISDGGKEVALKLLRTHSEIELRGVSHCINLKHPNLVHLYDLLTDAKGNKWLVMEYISGESLAQVIEHHPKGLPAAMAKEWFIAIAGAVAYLHDQSVVHRDLKPANIFVERGNIKIGDYGLSRRISASQRDDLSSRVGTMHYMAPEVKNGNYTRAIDVYASGVILYEMLTGHPPFEGETPGEILAKHQFDDPDLSSIPSAYKPLLAKALHKDPAERFATMTEFARAVEAIDSGTRVNPGTLPAPSAPTEIAPAAPPAATLPAPRPRLLSSGPLPVAWRERTTELCASLATAPVVAAVCILPCIMFVQHGAWSAIARALVLSTGLSWAVLVVARPVAANQSSWHRRRQLFLAGIAVGGLAFWLDGWTLPSLGALYSDSISRTRFGNDLLPTLMRYAFYFGLALGLGRWWRLSDRRRGDRFRLTPLISAGFWGMMLLFLWPWESENGGLGVASLVVAAVAVQVASPYSSIPQPGRERNRRMPRVRRQYSGYHG